MSKGGGDQTVTQRPDPQTEKYRNIYWNATLNRLGMGSMGQYNQGGTFTGGAQQRTPGKMFGPNGYVTGRAEFGGFPIPGSGRPTGGAPAPAGAPAGASPMSPSVVRVADYDPGFNDAYTGVQGLGDAAARQQGLGYDAANRFLDPAQFGQTAQQYMNPYIEGVIDPLRAQFDETSARRLAQIKSQQTMSGAYGGSRHGVAEGQALRGMAQDENLAIANLMSSGYRDAATLAAQAGQLGANLGMGAGQLASGAYQQQGGFAEQARRLQQEKFDIPLRELGILGGALGQGPAGQTTTQPTSSNPFLSAAGGAMAGASVGGPVGGLIGGGIGLLGGLF